MKGICFIEPLFHATVEGRKTQTRRIIELQPQGNLFGVIEYTKPKRKEVFRKFDFDCGLSIVPRYRVGETLYIKEPYYVIPKETPPISDKNRCLYKYGWDVDISPIFENKLFMPAKYARYFIKITAVRCERLQDISDEDCLKEGIKKLGEYADFNCYYDECDRHFATPREAYAALIDSINGKGTWDSNPFVWVYEYRFA